MYLINPNFSFTQTNYTQTRFSNLYETSLGIEESKKFSFGFQFSKEDRFYKDTSIKIQGTQLGILGSVVAPSSNAYSEWVLTWGLNKAPFPKFSSGVSTYLNFNGSQELLISFKTKNYENDFSFDTKFGYETLINFNLYSQSSLLITFLPNLAIGLPSFNERIRWAPSDGQSFSISGLFGVLPDDFLTTSPTVSNAKTIEGAYEVIWLKQKLKIGGYKLWSSNKKYSRKETSFFVSLQTQV